MTLTEEITQGRETDVTLILISNRTQVVDTGLRLWTVDVATIAKSNRTNKEVGAIKRRITAKEGISTTPVLSKGSRELIILEEGTLSRIGSRSTVVVDSTKTGVRVTRQIFSKEISARR